MLTDEQVNRFIAEIERIMNYRALTLSSDNPLNLNTRTLSLSATLLGHLDASQVSDVFIGAVGYRRL